MNIIRNAIDSIIDHYRIFICIVIMISCSVAATLLFMYYYGVSVTKYIEWDNVLKNGIDNCGVVYVDFDGENTPSDEELILFEKEVYSRKEISGFGYMSKVETQDFSDGELALIQQNEALANMLEGELVSSRALTMCNINLEYGMELSEMTFDDEQTYLYLGAAYRGIEPGTTYYGADGRKYVVAGIMEKGQRMIERVLLLEGGSIEGDNTDLTFDTYSTIIFIDDFTVANSMMLSAAEGYSIKEAMECVKEIADKYKLRVEMDSLETVIEIDKVNTQGYLPVFLKISMILMITAVIMIVVLQISLVFRDAKQYGIMYSIGYSRRDINAIILVKQLIADIIAFIFGMTIFYYLMIYSNNQESISEIYARIIIPYGVPGVVLMILLITFITHEIIVLFMKKMTPVKLLNS